MSTKRYGNKVVSDLSKAILFIIKRGASSVDEVADLLSSSYDYQKIRKRVYSLTNNKFLKIEPGQEIKITNKGLSALNNLKLRSINPNKVWDKRWRMVIYDIPEDKRVARNKIRQLLKELGFKQLQYSVWVHPLPCLEQFIAIRKAYGINNHLFLFEINDSFEFDNLKRQFAKKYSQLIVH